MVSGWIDGQKLKKNNIEGLTIRSQGNVSEWKLLT